MHHWLEPVFARASAGVELIEGAEHLELVFLGAAIAAFAGGSGLAYWIYVLQKGKPAQSFVEAMPGLHALVVDKWRIDELYEEYVIGAVDSLAEFFAWADKWIVDFILARVSTFLDLDPGTVLPLHPDRPRANLRRDHGARPGRRRLVLRHAPRRGDGRRQRRLRRLQPDRGPRPRLQLPLGSEQRRQMGRR